MTAFIPLTAAEKAALDQFRRTQPGLNKASNLQADVNLGTILDNFSTAMALMAVGERVLDFGELTLSAGTSTKFTGTGFTLSGATFLYPSSASAAALSLTRVNRADNVLSGAAMTVTANHATHSGTAIFNYIHVAD